MRCEDSAVLVVCGTSREATKIERGEFENPRLSGCIDTGYDHARRH
jgi:hypothetical protein